MTRAVRTTKLKRPYDAAFTDFSEWVDRAGYQPPAADLKGAIANATLRFVDPDGTIPFEPVAGVVVQLEDATPEVVFGGWIVAPVIDVPGPLVPAWTCTAQSWATRLAESATGSLNQSGILDTDRNFVIAMFIDALGATSQQFATDDVGTNDAIVAANVAAGWSGVQGTCFLYGTDWSYRPLLDVLQDIIDRVPGVNIRIRPDMIVEYGVFATPAPVVLAAARDADLMSQDNVVEIDAASYTEELLAAGHFNKVRLGGEAAAEATAYDQTSFGKLGRVMAAPYEDRPDLPAADVERAAYAKLATFAPRRIAKAITTNDKDALVPGMLVSVLVSDLGCWEDEGWGMFPGEMYFGSPLLEPAQGYRGEMLVQKVTPTFIAPGVQAYEIELGAYVADFDHAIAALVGGPE